MCILFTKTPSGRIFTELNQGLCTGTMTLPNRMAVVVVHQLYFKRN